jgi:hypothetical protein
VILLLSALAAAGPASAVPYHFVDWLSANPGAGTASGVIALDDLSTVTIHFSVTTPTGSPGSYSFAQTAGGTNYWNPSISRL